MLWEYASSNLLTSCRSNYVLILTPYPQMLFDLIHTPLFDSSCINAAKSGVFKYNFIYITDEENFRSTRRRIEQYCMYCD